MKGEIRPPRLDPPPAQPMMMSGWMPYLSMASLGLQADDALVEEHLVEHAAQHIAVPLLAGGGLHGLGDGAAQGAGGAWVIGAGSSGPRRWCPRERG